MKKTIYQIDEEGFMTYETIEIKPSSTDEEDNHVYEIPEGYVDTPLPSNEYGQLPFYRPRWTGEVWVEDMSLEEIEKIVNAPKELTEIEKLKVSQAEQFESILELLGGM